MCKTEMNSVKMLLFLIVSTKFPKKSAFTETPEFDRK